MPNFKFPSVIDQVRAKHGLEPQHRDIFRSDLNTPNSINYLDHLNQKTEAEIYNTRHNIDLNNKIDNPILDNLRNTKMHRYTDFLNKSEDDY